MIEPINNDSSPLQNLSLDNKGTTEKKKELGQDVFLELMVAQLNNQDPLNPMEGGDFLGQLAQFSTVNGISSLEKSFSTLAASLQSNQALQASTMVGRSVLVEGQTAQLVNAEGLSAAVDLKQPASNIVVRISDANGQDVKAFNLGDRPSGLVNFTWDGTTDAGDPAVPGNYAISVEARIDNENVSLETLIKSRVESVTLLPAGKGVQLNLASGGLVDIKDVRQIL